MRTEHQTGRGRGFTLVEILVVVAIMLLVAIVALPTVYSSLSGRQVDDAARVLTGMLAGVRDAAIRYGEPRGLRLLPDTQLTSPAPGTATQGTLALAYNRMVMIEPGGRYSEGRVNVGPQYPVGTAFPFNNFPPVYPRQIPGQPTQYYPFFPSNPTNPSATPLVLMVEESPFGGGFSWTRTAGNATTGGSPNPPTNWYWNVRVGDRIKFHSAGRPYTIIGPVVQSPWTTGDNPELYVNVGPLGSPSPLRRQYYLVDTTVIPVSTTPQATYNPEFLFLVNGEDDNADGYVDAGWDGFNNNPPMPNGTGNIYTDDLTEWEPEAWVGAAQTLLSDPDNSGGSPSATWVGFSNGRYTADAPYTIERRPVPSLGAREVSLPAGVVIDATSWNYTGERSRISNAIQPGSLYADIMINPNGQFIPTTVYSAPTATGAEPFMHFWLTIREDVYPLGTLWGTTTSPTGTVVPNPNPGASSARTYLLPMPADALGTGPNGDIVSGGFYPPPGNPTLPVLKGDRRLVTLFTQSGLVVTNNIDAVPPPNVGTPQNPIYRVPGEGFKIDDVLNPFYRAQLGQREVK